MRSAAALLVAALAWSAPAGAQAPPASPAPAHSAAPAPGPAQGAAASPIVYEVVEANGVPTIPAPLTAKPGDPKEGLKVVTGRRLGNCLACHGVSSLAGEEFHGEIGPPLDGVGERWAPAALRMILVDPKRVFTAETVMPAFHRADGFNRVRAEFRGKPILTAQQVEDVVAYLAGLK